MDLKAYQLTYKNFPWYYGASVFVQDINQARGNTHALWELMCMREPINLTLPALDVYDVPVYEEDDDYD